MNTSSDSVSFVIIGRNEGGNIARCLKSVLAEAERCREWEVIYVDAGSTDRSKDIARAMGVRVLGADGRQLNAAAARNLGYLYSKGQNIQFLDGDMTLLPGFVAVALSELKVPGTGAVAGLLIEREPAASFGNAAFGQDWNRDMGDVSTLGGAALWRRETLKDLGGFDASLPLGEDPDLSLRAGLRGWRLHRMNFPMATHDLGIRGLRAYFSRACRVGFSRFVVSRRHPAYPPLHARIKRDMVRSLLLLLFWLPICVDYRFLAPTAILGAFEFLRQFRSGGKDGGSFKQRASVALHRIVACVPMTLGAAEAWFAGHGRRPPEADRIAYLASEIPSTSATFVYRELLALEGLGWKAYPFALRCSGGRGVSSDGLPLKARTQVLYGRPIAVLLDAVAHTFLDPLATVRALGFCLRDAMGGSEMKFAQRLKLPWQALVGLSLARKLRLTCVRHLHIHFIHAPSNVGMYAAIAARLPFSIVAHANDLFVERSLCVEKAARAAFLTTISEVNRTELVRLGADRSKVRLLPCGVDVRYFAPGEQVSGDSTSIVSVGRLVPKKGFDLLLRAFREVSQRHPGLQLRIVGDGPEEVNLRALAKDLQIESRVHFLLALGRRRIREELSRASLFVLPCRRDAEGDVDGIPVVLMEAMAMAIPVISTHISGVPELIRHGEDGMLVPPEDVARLVCAMDDLLCDHEARSSLGRAGRERILDRHNLLTLAERLSDWVREGATMPEERKSATGISVRVPVMLELKS